MCWSWNSNIFAIWGEELTHLKRPWCWERLKAGGEGDNRGWDGWMESPTQWTRVWASSGSWRWTGRPGMLQSMGLQRVRHDWATELKWHVIYVFLFLTLKIRMVKSKDTYFFFNDYVRLLSKRDCNISHYKSSYIPTSSPTLHCGLRSLDKSPLQV